MKILSVAVAFSLIASTAVARTERIAGGILHIPDGTRVLLKRNPARINIERVSPAEVRVLCRNPYALACAWAAHGYCTIILPTIDPNGNLLKHELAHCRDDFGVK